MSNIMRDTILSLLYGLFLTSLIIVTHWFFTPVVVLEVSGKQTDNVQVFFDEGPGFREENVDSRYLIDVEEVQRLTFRSKRLYGLKALHQIRIDPRTSEGTLSIHSLEIKYRFKRFRLKGDQILPRMLETHDIGEVTRYHDFIEIESTGEDPFFSVLFGQETEPSNWYRLPSQTVAVCLWLLMSAMVFGIQRTGSRLPRLNELRINQLEKGLIWLIFCWFIFQMFFFATQMDFRVPPDEMFHDLVSIAYFEADGFNIQDKPETYHLGTVAKRPYLYHLLLGKLLHLKWTGIDRLLYMRCLNILISIATLLASLRLVQELTSSRWVQFTVMVVQSNLLMYVFLASMVSYDNLTNLFAALAALFLFRYLKRSQNSDLTWLIICNGLGLLTKISFAPICLIHALILCAHLNKSLWSTVKNYLSKPHHSIQYFGYALVILLFVLNVRHYGTNLMQYGQLDPVCHQVLAPEACAQSLLVQRSIELRATVDERPKFDTYSYFARWADIMFTSIVGVLTHQTIEPPVVARAIAVSLLAFSILLGLIHFRWLKWDVNLWVGVIVLGYSGFVFHFGISNYQQLYAFVAIQGRYLFPVITLLLYLATQPLFLWGNRAVKLMMAALLVGLIMQCGFSHFLANAGAIWYTSPQSQPIVL